MTNQYACTWNRILRANWRPDALWNARITQEARWDRARPTHADGRITQEARWDRVRPTHSDWFMQDATRWRLVHVQGGRALESFALRIHLGFGHRHSALYSLRCARHHENATTKPEDGTSGLLPSLARARVHVAGFSWYNSEKLHTSTCGMTRQTQRQATVGESKQMMMYSQPYSPQALDRTHSNSMNIPNTIGRAGFHTQAPPHHIYTERLVSTSFGMLTSRDRQ